MVSRRGGRDLVHPYGPSARKLPNQEFSILMEDAPILFLNFSGIPGTYNQEGDRNFAVVIDEEVAEDMLEDGWNVKQLKDRDDEPGDHYLSVSVKYRDRFGKELRPPKLVVVNSKGRLELDETNCDIIDKVDIAKVDLIINGRTRDEDGVRKIKGYLKSMFITLVEDPLEMKYANELPETNAPLAIEAPDEDPLAGMDIHDAELVED